MDTSNELLNAVNHTFAVFHEVRSNYSTSLILHDVDIITHIATGIAEISSFSGVGLEGGMEFPDNVFDIEEHDATGLALPDDTRRKTIYGY